MKDGDSGSEDVSCSVAAEWDNVDKTHRWPPACPEKRANLPELPATFQYS